MPRPQKPDAGTADPAPASPPGRQKVSAVIGQKVAQLELAIGRERIKWPPRGMPHDGVMPGGWKEDGPEDDTGFLPADCPVRPLGYDGENYYFIDTSGQVFNTGDKALGVERMQKLFAGMEEFLCWAWPAWSGSGKTRYVTGFKTEEARRDLFAACRARGPWSPTDMVRGRGAWLDASGDTPRLILHCGEFLYVDGKQEDTGELGDHFYVRRPRAIAPWGKPIERAADNPAVKLCEALNTWHFVRGNVDVLLLLGWLGVAMMGAALEWRPSVFIVGDFGTGKSELHKLAKHILGRGMISTTNATSAGLYQIVGHDALPVCIDEIEGEDAPDQAQQIIKMARDAASGSVRIRGGADHKGVEFAARSAFLFSAINPPPIPRASLSRLAVLQLRTLDPGTKPPVLEDPADIGPKMLQRIADHFGDFPRLYGDYQDVLRQGGHSSRGQNTFGTLLASAHLLLGDEGMEALGYPVEKLDPWAELLAASDAPEVAGSDPNWLRCIQSLLGAPIDAWNKGERSTVGQILSDIIERPDNTAGDLKAARDKLGSSGLGLIEPGLAFEGYGLAVPCGGRAVNKLLEDTSWSGRGEDGGWTWALGQAPPTIVRSKIERRGARHGGKLDNRVMIAGVQRRCQFIGLKELTAWQEERE